MVCGRLADLGGWAKVRAILPDAVEDQCSKCHKTIVMGKATLEFVKEHPQPFICHPCAKRLGMLGGTELARSRDPKTGVLRTTQDVGFDPEGMN